MRRNFGSVVKLSCNWVLRLTQDNPTIGGGKTTNSVLLLYEMARLWIEKGRLWEYYRENNPKNSRKIMDEYFRKQEIRE